MRPANDKMELIHASMYDACYGAPNDGKGSMLTITRGDSWGGIVLRGAMADIWADEIHAAMDQIEADDICQRMLKYCIIDGKDDIETGE